MTEISTKRAYFPHVEGLRGVSSLYVFLFHLSQRAVLLMSPIAFLAPSIGFLSGGHYAVSIFIVVSGYCLGYPVARSLAAPFDEKSFAKRRFRRLYPAYAVALILALPVFYIDGTLEFHHHPPLSHIAIAMVSHLLMVHNLSNRTVVYLSAPMWSIALEVQIYVIFALVLIPVWKRFGVLAQLGVALVLSLLPHFLAHGALDSTCPWLLGLFAMGVCAADETARGPRAKVPWAWIAGGATVVAAALAGTHMAYDQITGSRNFILPDILVGAAISLLFVASAADSRWIPARILGSRPLQFLGTFSYSLYLIHATVIGLVWAILIRYHVPATGWLVAWTLAIPATIAAAYALFLFAEKPFLSRAFRENLQAAHVEPLLLDPEPAST